MVKKWLLCILISLSPLIYNIIGGYVLNWASDLKDKQFELFPNHVLQILIPAVFVLVLCILRYLLFSTVGQPLVMISICVGLFVQLVFVFLANTRFFIFLVDVYIMSGVIVAFYLVWLFESIHQHFQMQNKAMNIKMTKD